MGQLQAQLAQTQTELQYAIEQIRILTLQVNRNTSAVTTAATTTAPTATSAGSHSRMPKINHQFGKDIIPNIFDGKQRNDFREWAENSALYLSAQCVDACEILLEWLVMEKEHVTEAAIQIKCEEEEWEYDSISTFSRVTFVYLSMRTTGIARKIATSGKRGDGRTPGGDCSRSTILNWLLERRPYCAEHCPWEEQEMSLTYPIAFKNWKSW